MASWFILTLVAAFFLGLYDIAKKHAVTANAVPPVLLLNVATSASIWGILVLLTWTQSLSHFSQLGLCQLSIAEHWMLLGKSALVGSSWMFAFVAIKHLPISIASPIRATSPLWTILLAVVMMQERPLGFQWLGISLILIAFYAFSLVSLKEGIRFRSNRHVWLMLVATLISAFCGLYDKYLLQIIGIKPAVVQAWFSIYLVPIMLPMFGYWWRFDRKETPFQFRWSIPLIAVCLLLADYFYFVAVAQPDALISVISPLRRSSIVIAFLFGILVLKEKNWRKKACCLVILLAGIYLIGLKS